MPRQYNLSLLQEYRVIKSYYGSLEETGGACCENCGRLIANIAIVEGQNDKKQYLIGMDCAETLTGIKDNFDFNYIHKVNFNVAKQYRASVLKLIKKSLESNLKPIIAVYDSGTKGVSGIDFQTTDFRASLRWWKYVQNEVFTGYVYPMIKEIIKPYLKVA